MAIEIGLQPGDADEAIERSKWTTTGKLIPEGEYNVQITEFKAKKITAETPNKGKDAIQLRGKLIAPGTEYNGLPVQKHINAFYGAHYDALALSVALGKVPPGATKIILPSEREAIGKIVGVIIAHEPDNRAGKVDKDGNQIIRAQVKTFKPRFRAEGEAEGTPGEAPKTKVNF